MSAARRMRRTSQPRRIRGTCLASRAPVVASTPAQSASGGRAPLVALVASTGAGDPFEASLLLNATAVPSANRGSARTVAIARSRTVSKRRRAAPERPLAAQTQSDRRLRARARAATAVPPDFSHPFPQNAAIHFTVPQLAGFQNGTSGKAGQLGITIDVGSFERPARGCFSGRF